MMKRKRKLPIKIILLTFLIFFIFYFIFIFRFEEVIIETEPFKNHLKEYFEGKSLYEIFSKMNEIMVNFPEIKKLEIKINIFKKKLNIKITNSKIIAKICDPQKCLYLDSYGEIIEPKLKNSNQANLLKINSSLPIERDTLLNPEIKNLLSLVFEYANWKPLILKEINLYSNFDVGVIDKNNREFLFDPEKEIEEQIKKLHIFLTQNLAGQRIDLRIPKKIFFK